MLLNSNNNDISVLLSVSAASYSHLSPKSLSPVTMDTRQHSVSPPTMPHYHASPRSLPSPSNQRRSPPSATAASWSVSNGNGTEDIPLNLTKPRDIKIEKHDDSYGAKLSIKSERIKTPPPAHSNHKRVSASPPSEVSTFSPVRMPLGFPHYVTSPFMMTNPLLGSMPSVLNGKTPSDLDKVWAQFWPFVLCFLYL